MIQKEIIIITIDDILKPKEIVDYHRQWNKFLAQEGTKFEKPENVVRGSEHIMLGRIFQYKDYHIVRSVVLQTSWIPYEPSQPMWNPKQDYIEVIEQMRHAGRKKIAKKRLQERKMLNILVVEKILKFMDI